MASKIVLCILIFNLATLVRADGSLKVGEFTSNSNLVYHGTFKATGIFFLKRTETFDVKLTDGGKIKGIDIQDLTGDSSSYILAGGVDHGFVKIRLESKRGSGYDFIVNVYSDDYDNTDDSGHSNNESDPAEGEFEKNESTNGTGDKETENKNPHNENEGHGSASEDPKSITEEEKDKETPNKDDTEETQE